MVSTGRGGSPARTGSLLGCGPVKAAGGVGGPLNLRTRPQAAYEPVAAAKDAEGE